MDSLRAFIEWLEQIIKAHGLHRDVWRVTIMGKLMQLMLRQSGWRRATRRRATRPPCSRLYSFFRFVCSRKQFKRVYEPKFADMRSEYFDAIQSQHTWKARWVIMRTRLELLMTVLVSLGLSVIDKAIKIWKIGG